jgi:hypothetical protein
VTIDDRLADLDAEADSERWYAFRERIRELRNAALGEKNDEFARELEIELEAWYLSPDTAIHDTERTNYRPTIEYEDGTVWPKVEQISDEDWEYLERRASGASSLLISTRYADLVWFFKHRIRMAQLALERYPNLEEKYWNRHIEGVMSLSTDWVLSVIRPLEIAKEINDQAAYREAKKTIFARLQSISANSNFNGAYLSTWDAVISRHSHLNEAEREEISRLLVEAQTVQADNLHWLDSIQGLSVKWAGKQQDQESFSNALEKRAETLVRQARSEESNSRITAADRMGDAISLLEQAGRHRNQSRIEELQAERVALLSEPEIEYQTVTSEIEIDLSHADRFVDQLVSQGNSPALIPSVFLMAQFPDHEEIQREVEEKRDADPLLFSIAHQPITLDGVVEWEAESEEDIFQWYYWTYANQALHFSSTFIRRSIERIGESEWNLCTTLATIRSAPLVNPQRHGTIEIALSNYFSGDLRTALMLLALEFEPLVRGVVQKLGLSPVTTKNPTSPQLQRVKYLDECLDIPEIVQLLGDKWVTAAKAVLTHEAGSKLRHRVAHGRGIDDLVSQRLADVLVCLFLWVANYSVADDPEEAASPELAKNDTA